MVCFCSEFLNSKMPLPKRLFFIRIFRVLNTVQSFIFKVQFLSLSLLVFHQQLVHYIRVLRACQALFCFIFSIIFQIVAPFCGAFIILPDPLQNVNHYFTFFYIFFFRSFFFSPLSPFASPTQPPHKSKTPIFMLIFTKSHPVFGDFLLFL